MIIILKIYQEKIKIQIKNGRNAESMHKKEFIILNQII